MSNRLKLSRRLLQPRAITALSNERGAGTVIAGGVLTLLLLFATLAINGARYYNLRTQLFTTANQIASYSGTFLPNADLAYDRAVSLYNLMKFEPLSTTNRFPDDVAMHFYVTFLNDPDDPELTTVEYTGDISTIKLPIKSVTVSLEASLSLDLLNLERYTSAGVGSVTVSGEASAQLAPTDIVLVIENSNSVISPGVGSIMGDDPFAMWDDTKVGVVQATYGATQAPISKADIAKRQCFGETTFNMKRAAMMLFDLFTSSYTYRVGVVHTNAMIGEAPLATVRITSSYNNHVYERKYETDVPPYGDDPLSNAIPPLNQIFDWPIANSTYGTFDYPETRCAALTLSTDLKIPEHPLTSYVSNPFIAATVVREMKSMLKCAGAVDARCPSNSHLDFEVGQRNASLLPRDLIWLKSSGGTFESGYPNPKYDVALSELALERAADMLNTAPMRIDQLPVNRRVVLLLSDGFDVPVSEETGPSGGSDTDDRFFHRVVEVASTGDRFTQAERGLSLDGVGQTIDEYFCDPTKNQNNPWVEESTSLGATAAENRTGIKLGVLAYGFRGTVETDDRLIFLKDLPGHSFADDDPVVNEFRTECNTPWATNRGRFMVEASNMTLPADVRVQDGGKIYYEQVAPHVARSVFISELTK